MYRFSPVENNEGCEMINGAEKQKQNKNKYIVQKITGQNSNNVRNQMKHLEGESLFGGTAVRHLKHNNVPNYTSFCRGVAN